MEEVKKKSFKVTFYVSDLEKSIKYESIKFETLFIEPFSIDKDKIEINVNLTEEIISNGKINERIYLIPKTEGLPNKEYIITLFCDINNKYDLKANEEGDCCLEITSMWDVDYDYEGENIVKERKIPDIKYNGKILENYEKLYERKRWNIINAKIEKFEASLFSQETLDYLKKNGNKSYKYDILLTKENETKFLSEKTADSKIKLIDENEKEKLKQNLETLNSELISKINDMEKQNNVYECDNKKRILLKFWNNNRATYKNLEDTFKLYNKRWNFKEFSDNDFKLFLLFSEFQMYFKNYNSIKQIPDDLRESTFPKYQEFQKYVIENNNMNLIDKTRIICGFSKFCSVYLNNNNFPELVIIDDLKDDDPLKMARDKFKDVINNLKETSGLFKKLLLFDMASTQIINEWDLRDFEVITNKYESIENKMSTSRSAFNTFNNEFKKKNENENNTKITFPVLSMLTLDQVKNHSLDLLPKYIFKVPDVYNFNAVSTSAYRLSFFNESRILNNQFSSKKNPIDKKAYVLPYMIEISHETYSHLKTRYSNIYNTSPVLNIIKGKKKLLNPDDYKEESGYILENLLSDNFDELNNLKWRNINLFPLTDYKYWTDVNFNKMKEFNRLEMKKLGPFNNDFENDLYSFLSYDKRNYNDDEIMRCAFRNFNS